MNVTIYALIGSAVIGFMIWLRNKLIKLAQMETEKILKDANEKAQKLTKDRTIDELVADSNARRRSRSSTDH